MKVRSSFLVASILIAAHASAAENLLSLEETIELANMGAICPNSERSEIQKHYDKCSRGNPAARPQLYAQMDSSDPRLPLLFFAFVGQSEDVDKLTKKFIDLDHANLVGMEKECLSSTIHVLGRMAKRGVPEAKKRVEEMLYPAYWKDRPYNSGPTKFPDNFNFVEEMISYAVYAQSASNDPALAETLQAVLQRIEDPAQRKMMSQVVEQAIKHPQDDFTSLSDRRPGSEALIWVASAIALVIFAALVALVLLIKNRRAILHQISN